MHGMFLAFKRSRSGLWTLAFVILLFFIAVTFSRLRAVLLRLAPPNTFLLSSLLLSASGLLSPATGGLHDYNVILNDGLNQNIFPHLGQYGVRYTVEDDSPFPPSGCRVDVVNSLERHGARLMTDNALRSANATLVKIKEALGSVPTTALSTELQFLKYAELQSDTNSLVPYGALQAYYSGKSTATVYSSLSSLPPFVRTSGDEARHDDRVILTAKYWRLGFTGGRFPHATLRTQADVRNAAVGLPLPDVIFSELNDANNTLDVSTCTNSNDIPSSQGEKGAQYAFATSTIIPTAGARLLHRLKMAGATDLDLTGSDLINLASICSFDTLGRATTNQGRLSLKQSPFCDVYNETEWKTLGYAFDVGKWSGAGYGTPYYKALGTGFLRELVARFSGAPPPLAEPTSLNRTLDGNEKTFPLPVAGRGPLVYFDGSHDNNIGPIAAAAGLFRGRNLTTTFDAQRTPYQWVFSRIAPVQGKIVFEKLTCGTPVAPYLAEYVRIRANGAVLRHWCKQSSPISGGDLCLLSDFLQALSFVEKADEWNTCYG